MIGLDVLAQSLLSGLFTGSVYALKPMAIKDKEWVTVAPTEYAKTAATYPKPKWGA